MTSIGKSFVAGLAVSVALVALPGCEQKEGPVERAGKEIDKAVEKIGQNVERTGEKIQDAASGNKK